MSQSFCHVGPVLLDGCHYLSWHKGLTCYLLVICSASAAAMYQSTHCHIVAFSYIFHISCCMQGTISAGPLPHSICNVLLISVFYGPHCHVFVCYVWQNYILWPLLCCLVLPSMPPVIPLFRSITVPFNS